jgi:DNA-binding transcriptional regulator YdaS (Cro superfamily)
VSLESDLVKKAVELCGDKKRLAAILNVSVEDITSWAEGRTQAPNTILLRILILFSDGAEASH